MSYVACHWRQLHDERCPNYLNLKDNNNLTREIALIKSIAEILISRLKQWDLLTYSIQITFLR